MRKKLFYKTLSLITALIIGFSPLFTFRASFTYAEDSPEEIAREAEETRLEAERHAQKQAEEEAQRAAEAAREAIEDITPTPTPQPQPTTAPSSATPTPGSSETQAVNQNTGANSTNDADNSISENADVNNDNSADVNNNVNTNSNTGDNVISGDNPPATTPTPTPVKQEEPLPKCEDNLSSSNNNGGEEGTFSNEGGDVVNVNTETDPAPAATQNSDENSADSTSQESDTVAVTNSNCASVENQQDVIATTGENNASNNDGGVEAETGSGAAGSILINEGNINTTSETDSIQGQNAQEQDSNTDSSSDNQDLVSVENNNKIYAENDVNVESTTGGNDLTNNDGQALLTTGDVDILVSLLNILNLNISGSDFTHLIVNIFGNLNGEVNLEKIAQNLGMDERDIIAIARNKETEEEHNDREQNRNNDVEINNNNEAVVKNDVNVTGETGGNNLSGNDDRTKLLTGRIKILVALINFINTNYSGTEWYFAMVNLFGNLKGDIVLPDPNGFLVDDSVVTNNNTGENSQNNAESTTENNLTASNTNQATITNNIDVAGDSGSNNAYSNNDPVKQDTGNVSVVTQLTNWLNVNVIGNNWVLLVINVFGKWYGKIVGFPGKGTVEAPDSGMLMLAAGGAQNQGPSVTSNTSTQEGSTNDTSIENSDNMDVNNNNNAVVENNVKVTGVSGQNTTNENNDPVAVSTGWIDISADLLNIVNMNVVGKHWMMVIVNIFGNFLGDITFAGAKKPVTAEFTTSQSEDKTIEFELQPLGTVSNQDSQNNQEQEQSVTITPTPSLAVKIEILADNIQNESNEVVGKVEVYTASVEPENSTSNELNNQEDQSVKILGVSINAGREIQQTLFLIALLSYLIALRFLAFRKSS